MSQKKKELASVNFRRIEQRLEFAHGAIERIWAPSAEETQRVLQIRTLALAREPLREEAADEDLEVLEFTLAYERYAIESHFVRKVASLENLTSLPCTPAFVLGIVNLRGAIYPVIDLKKFFELPEKELTRFNKIILLQSEKVVFSILADTVIGVRHILKKHIQPTLPTLTGVRSSYLMGITPERLVVLDAEKLLMDESINVQDQVAE
ncbi:MAG: chemotaxis protein CheW [Nitrosospira sp.]